MPFQSWKVPINEQTPDEDLRRIILEATRTSDPNIQRAAAQAHVEVARRELKAKTETGEKWVESANKIVD